MPEFLVQGMSCSHCVNAVTEAVKKIDASARVDVDLATKRVRIESGFAQEALSQALNAAGYRAEAVADGPPSRP